MLSALSVVLLAFLAVAPGADAEGVSMLEDAEAMAQQLATVQGQLEKAWKQRDAALAQVKSMRQALQKKCGNKAADIASQKAALASTKLKEERARQRVRADQRAAKAKAAKANQAMATARAAVAERTKAQAALKAAQADAKKAAAHVKAMNAQSKLARASAKRLAESKASDGAIKAAYAKASALYAKVMDAKMRDEMARKRVSELGGTASKAQQTAKKQLLGAKGLTTQAAAKVKEAMKAQVKAAKEKRLIAEKQARVVTGEEQQLLAESKKLEHKITTAKLKSKKAADSVQAAKLAESRALEAVKMPANASPEEKKAFAAAKMKILKEQTGASANYASKIKNIEAKLLKSKQNARHANRSLAKLNTKVIKLKGKQAAEKDSIVKAKLGKKIRAINGKIKFEKKKVQKAKIAMQKAAKAQKQEIGDVVKSVVLSKDNGKSRAEREASVAAAAKAKKP